MEFEVLDAHAVSCDELELVVVSTRPSARVRVEVDGRVVARGVGGVTWVGPAFPDGRPSVVRAVGGPTWLVDRALALRASVDPPRDPRAPPLETAPTREVQVPLSVASPCGLGGLTWRLTGEGLGGETEGPLPEAALFQRDLALTLAVGTTPVTLEVLDGARVVHHVVTPVEVRPACVDSDGDGACVPWDCDDADPFTRPGLPDLVGDGRDNDCGRGRHGAVTWAGDVDGDGFEGPSRPEGPSDHERSVFLAAVPWRPNLVGQAFLAPRGPRPVDCDDADPRVFPGATEDAGGRDLDCDGAVEPQREIPVRFQLVYASAGPCCHPAPPPGWSLSFERSGRRQLVDLGVVGDAAPTLRASRWTGPDGRSAWFEVEVPPRPVDAETAGVERTVVRGWWVRPDGSAEPFELGETAEWVDRTTPVATRALLWRTLAPVAFTAEGPAPAPPGRP